MAGKQNQKDKAFDQKKRAILGKIGETSSENPDESPKGTLDEPIISLVETINKLTDYVTTSTCSGRVSIFVEGPKYRGTVGGKGDGGKWLLVAHLPKEMNNDWWEQMESPAATKSEQHSEEPVEQLSKSPARRSILFKFEPMIAHVKCRNFDAAKALYTVAMDCGFRESGIGSNFIVAIRTSMRLDVPLGVALDDKLVPFVSRDYVDHLLEISNEMFEMNFAKMNKLHEAIKKVFASELAS